MAQSTSIKTVKPRYKHNYSPWTLTSMDFNDLLPTQCIDTIASDVWKKINAKGVLRMNPTVFPPYGKVFIKNASFFVPLNQLLEVSDSFLSKQSLYKGKTAKIPVFSIDSLCYYYSTPSTYNLATVVDSQLDPSASNYIEPDPDTYDFFIPVNTSNGLRYTTYALNQYGLKTWKVLKLLGYEFPKFIQDSQGLIGPTQYSAKYNVSALNLLAYLKVYCDMYLSGVQYNTHPIVCMLQAIHDNENYSYNGTLIYNATSHEISSMSSLMDIIFHMVNVPHSQNIYLQAWNEIMSPNGVAAMSSSLANPTSLLHPINPGNDYITNLPLTSDNIVSKDVVATRTYVENQAAQMPGVHSYQQDQIRDALFKYIQRNNLAGTKAAQMLYARFGIKTDDFLNNFVHKLSEGSEVIDFNAVMNNNGASGSVLGDYAGYGASGINVKYSYDCNSYGILLTLHWLQIVPIMIHGMNPSVLRTDAFDFYQPEYDGKASRAVPIIEVSGSRLQSAVGPKDTSVFGYMPIYNEYRELRDRVAGSFVRGAAKNYFFGRDFTPFRDVTTFKPQTEDVQYYNNDDNPDLTNPYNVYKSTGDRFFLELEWDIEAVRDISSSAVAYDIDGEGDTDININGTMLN